MRPYQPRYYTMVGRPAAERAEVPNRTNLQKVFRGAFWWSGRTLALSNCRGPLQHTLGSALAYQKQANSFQQIGGRIHSSGEEYVSLRFMIVNSYLARN